MTHQINPMVEIVARALWEKEWPASERALCQYPGFQEWDTWPENGRLASLAQVERSKEDYRDLAFVAIEAMRKPDPNQLATMWRIFKGDWRNLPIGPGPAFKEAIESYFYAALVPSWGSFRD